MRTIQAQAGNYPTSEAYYDALNAAMARWRNKRQGLQAALPAPPPGAVPAPRGMPRVNSFRASVLALVALVEAVRQVRKRLTPEWRTCARALQRVAAW